MQNLKRRGFELGPAPKNKIHTCDFKSEWIKGMPIQLEGACSAAIDDHKTTIATTESFVMQILEGGSCEDLLMSPPYDERINSYFECLGSAYNEGDEQEIETVLFDSISKGGAVAEDLWMKVSWLSFHDEDASIRFRFSFGVDLEEDVAADPFRQQAAADLAEQVFPESRVISKNAHLHELLKDLMQLKQLNFVERILYFNAPNGGAYLHHDLERGHAGVVYAQISGSTLWLALPQQALVYEIEQFLAHHALPSSLTDVQQAELLILADNNSLIGPALNSFAHDGLISLINETSEFVQQLISNGHYRVLSPGDLILLPQKNAQTCCWHSVFSLGDEMGQALSFAVK